MRSELTMQEELTQEMLWQQAVNGDPAARASIAELADHYSRMTY
jgi:hypothetical protein